MSISSLLKKKVSRLSNLQI